MSEGKQYCVREGKYGYEIACCNNGTTWDEVVKDLIARVG